MASIYRDKAREALGIPMDKHEAVYIIYPQYGSDDDVRFFTSHQSALTAAKKMLKDHEKIHVENLMLYADWYEGPKHPGFYLLYTREMAAAKKDFRTVNIMGDMEYSDDGQTKA